MDSFAAGFTSVLALPSPTDRIGMLYPPSGPHSRMQVGRAA
jgi:hypothetical protein